MTMTENNGPLKGIRVADFSHQAAGPWCTTLLGDMGADVWKIEKPGRGDGIRYGGGSDPVVGGLNFWGLNRNKRSVGIDIKAPGAQALLDEIIASSDVVLENFRPGVMDRLGLGYERLSKINPRLVYLSITAFGKTGPMKDAPGMDLILEATSGIMGLTGIPGGPPIKPAPPIADISTGIYAAYGVALGLLHRERTGQGQRIDLSMLEASISMLADLTTTFLNTGVEYERFGTGHPDLVPYQSFDSSDGYFIVACLTNAFYKRLVTAMGVPHLMEDERYATNNARVMHRDEIVGILQAIFMTNTREHWLELCATADVPACRVNSLTELFEMEQLQAQGSVADWRDSEDKPFKTMDIILKMDASPGSLRIPPPPLSAHTEEVLLELGKTPVEIEALRSSGVCA
jgi:crotonobetainyl-CoA:carnitine CoA-transferase CaiB-like acyl-CoA transferase